MKKICLIFLISITSSLALAEIVQHDESTIEADLSFKWEQDEESVDRDVASSDEKNENEEESKERDVASEPQSDGIQYWKYEEE